MPKVTICSLHDSITANAHTAINDLTKIYDQIDLDHPTFKLNIDEVVEILYDLKEFTLPSILSDTTHAKSCGQRMENALIERKDSIKELNTRIEELEDRISYLKSELDYEKIEYRKG